jgi:hypothetical protein
MPKNPPPNNLPNIHKKTTGPAAARYTNNVKEPTMLDGINISEPDFLQRTFMSGTVHTDNIEDSQAGMTHANSMFPNQLDNRFVHTQEGFDQNRAMQPGDNKNIFLSTFNCSSVDPAAT